MVRLESLRRLSQRPARPFQWDITAEFFSDAICLNIPQPGPPFTNSSLRFLRNMCYLFSTIWSRYISLPQVVASGFWSDEMGKVEHRIQNQTLDFILQPFPFGNNHIRFTEVSTSTCKHLAICMFA